ncbi:hypothetical protein T440DRAFT_459541 [Plenodomus tracheiphilus IPT5]|uniref:Serine hydrolase domain-containing protein n=1 Tax=Plenodomus tracheiphilus IPT5 TaxID=1408161 RepID=A0A6A7AU19_9PLEO|nr:hypothetical protein T440DRAFT_459541 [Plenodomus tracheiphilus IPT5]
MATQPSLAGSAAKPTILAFHGSGSNATVHTVQLARLMRFIKSYFNVESLQAPFPSPAGPGILPFFEGCDPFYRWLPPTEKITLEAMHTGNSTHILAPEVESLIASTIQRIQSTTGSKVVGLIGFSQGTKVVAGLLRGLEIRRAMLAAGEEEVRKTGSWLDDILFGVSICGSYPPPLIPASVLAALDKVSSSSSSSSATGSWTQEEKRRLLEKKIEIPTFHVQGTNDEWKWAGDGLIEGHYEVEEGKSVKVEWEMGHHYPVLPEESERVGGWMVEVLNKAEGEGEAR